MTDRFQTPSLPHPDALLAQLGDGGGPSSLTEYYEWETTSAPLMTRSSSPATEYCEWEVTPAPSIIIARPTLTPCPPPRETPSEFREFSIVSGVSESRAESQPAGRSTSRGYLSDADKVSVVRWLFNHRHMYADKNTPKAAFWKSCAEYIETEMGKTYRHIDRVVTKWEKARRKEIEEAKMESGVAKSDTDWHQAMDEWIVFLDDLKADEAERRDTKAAEEADARRIAQEEQSKMASRMSDRKRSREEAEEAEEAGVLESLERESTAATAQANAPSQPLNRRRKRGRKNNEVEEYGKSLSSSLQSFGSTFAKEMGAIMIETVSGPMNKVHSEIQGLKEDHHQLMSELRAENQEVRQDQQRLMSEMRAENQDQQRLILEILSELRKR